MQIDNFYSFGYSPAVISLLQKKTADAHAALLLAELKPDMHVLDAGCGPGAITVGLAQAVPKGRVVGVDIEPSQIELAINRAQELDLGNCEFYVGNVLQLPFEDEVFDAVYGHMILMQFNNPAPVLQELGRIVKPGGLLSFREIDHGAAVAFPPTSAQARVIAALRESTLRNGGFPDIGRQLPSLLAESGYEVMMSNLSYGGARSISEKQRWCQWLIEFWSEADFVDRGIADGWLSAEDRDSIAAALDTEASDMTIVYASTNCEVLAKKRDRQ